MHFLKTPLFQKTEPNSPKIPQNTKNKIKTITTLFVME